MIKTKSILLCILLFVILTTPVIFAHETDYEHDEISSTSPSLPIGLQKIAEENKSNALGFLGGISIFIAFLAGILSIFSPCTLGILPAFFAYSFKEKKEITKKTFLFFIGFAIIFVGLGLIASALGKTLAGFQSDNSWLVMMAGFLLIIFGFMNILGKGFSGFVQARRLNKYGTFGFGLAFALGWTACIGPILAGILSIAAVLNSYFYSGALLASYSLGLFVPLFLFAFFYDKLNIAENKFIRGKQFNFLGFSINTTNLISGAILILIGLVFVIYKGTGVLNGILNSTLYSPMLVYNVNNWLLSLKYVNLFGAVALILFSISLGIFLKRKVVFK